MSDDDVFDISKSFGYTDALEFLKSTDRLHLIDKELSTDGYTLVALANCLYKEDLAKKERGL